MQQTILQGFYGSDGTRTRDLRRDRPASRFAIDPPKSRLVVGEGLGARRPSRQSPLAATAPFHNRSILAKAGVPYDEFAEGGVAGSGFEAQFPTRTLEKTGCFAPVVRARDARASETLKDSPNIPLL
jgi:hypothetical protein